MPAVLWFNVLMGFAYIATGVGFLRQKHRAVWSAMLIAVSTLLVFAALGLSIALTDLVYETRTIGSMTLRSVVWLVLSFLAYKSITKGGLNEH